MLPIKFHFHTFNFTLLRSHIHTFKFTLSHFYFYGDTLTGILSLSHFYVDTFTFTLLFTPKEILELDAGRG